jgi:hypothetical protein
MPATLLKKIKNYRTLLLKKQTHRLFILPLTIRGNPVPLAAANLK